MIKYELFHFYFLIECSKRKDDEYDSKEVNINGANAILDESIKLAKFEGQFLVGANHTEKHQQESDIIAN